MFDFLGYGGVQFPGRSYSTDPNRAGDQRYLSRIGLLRYAERQFDVVESREVDRWESASRQDYRKARSEDCLVITVHNDGCDIEHRHYCSCCPDNIQHMAQP